MFSKEEEEKARKKAAQKQHKSSTKAAAAAAEARDDENDELPNVHAEKVVDVFQSGARGETTARAEKENADRAASRKK